MFKQDMTRFDVVWKFLHIFMDRFTMVYHGLPWFTMVYLCLLDFLRSKVSAVAVAKAPLPTSAAPRWSPPRG